jgi:hypothetical protein
VDAGSVFTRHVQPIAAADQALRQANEFDLERIHEALKIGRRYPQERLCGQGLRFLIPDDGLTDRSKFQQTPPVSYMRIHI